MKRLAPLVALLPALSLGGPARAVSPESAAEVLAPLESLSPTGILLDRALPLSDSERFDGSAGAPSADAALWRQMYDEVRRASRRPVGPDVETLREAAKRSATAGEIPLAFLDFEVDRVRPGALEDGAIEVRDGRLVPLRLDALTPGRIFAAAALHERTFRGASVTFALDRSAYFGDEMPVELAIDFADGRGLLDRKSVV